MSRALRRDYTIAALARLARKVGSLVHDARRKSSVRRHVGPPVLMD